MLSDLADLIEEGHLDQRASVRSKTSANLAGRRRSSQLGRDDLSTGSEAPTNRRSVVRQAPEPAGRKALRNIRKASRSYEHVAASSRGAIHVGKASHHQKRASRDTIRYQKEKLANAAKGREFEESSWEIVKHASLQEEKIGFIDKIQRMKLAKDAKHEPKKKLHVEEELRASPRRAMLDRDGASQRARSLGGSSLLRSASARPSTAPPPGSPPRARARSFGEPGSPGGASLASDDRTFDGATVMTGEEGLFQESWSEARLAPLLQKTDRREDFDYLDDMEMDEYPPPYLKQRTQDANMRTLFGKRGPARRAVEEIARDAEADEAASSEIAPAPGTAEPSFEAESLPTAASLVDAPPEGEALSETPSVANLSKDEEAKYFGDDARASRVEDVSSAQVRRGVPRALSKQAAMVTSLDELKMVGPVDYVPELDDSDDDDDRDPGIFADPASPRHQFLIELVRMRDLPPECVLLRRDLTTTLNLSHRGLGDGVGEVTIGPLFRALEKMGPKLKTLDLSQNDLDWRSAAQLSSFIKRKVCGLVELRVAHADFDDSELASVMDSVKTNRTLRTLDLRGNGIGGANELYGASGYATKMVKVKATPIAGKPVLAARGSSRRGSVSESRLVAKERNEFSSRRLRDSGGGGFGDLAKAKEQASLVAGLTEQAKRAQQQGSGCLELGAMLVRNTTLTHLDLSWNRISGRDAALLGDALAGNDGLTFLSLAFNALEDSGAQQIAAALKFNDILEHLDVSGNNVGPKAAVVFSHALRENTNLRALVLDTNPLGFDGVRAIARELYGEPDANAMEVGEGDSEPLRAAALAYSVGIPYEVLEKTTQERTETAAETLERKAQEFLQKVPPRDVDRAPFDPEMPKGYYQLELAKPYHRAVADEIFELCARRPGVRLARVSYSEAPVESRAEDSFRPLKLGALRPAPQWGLNGIPPKVGAEPAEDAAKEFLDLAEEDHGAFHRRESHAFAMPGLAQFQELRKARQLRAAKVEKAKNKAMRLMKMLKVMGKAEDSKRRLPVPVDGSDAPFAQYAREEAIEALEAHAVVDLSQRAECQVKYQLPAEGCLRVEVKLVPRLSSQLELLTREGMDELLRFIRENHGMEHLDVIRALTMDHRFLCRQVQELIQELAGGVRVEDGNMNVLQGARVFVRGACRTSLGDSGPEGAPFIGGFAEESIDPRNARKICKSLYFTEGTAQRYGVGAFRNATYGRKPLCGAIGDDFFANVVLAEKPRGTFEFDYSSILPVEQGSKVMTDAEFERTLDECGLPLKCITLSDKQAHLYLDPANDEPPKGAGDKAGDPADKRRRHRTNIGLGQPADLVNTFYRARAAVIDGRFFNDEPATLDSHRDVYINAHDRNNVMAFVDLPKKAQQTPQQMMAKNNSTNIALILASINRFMREPRGVADLAPVSGAKAEFLRNHQLGLVEPAADPRTGGKRGALHGVPRRPKTRATQLEELAMARAPTMDKGALFGDLGAITTMSRGGGDDDDDDDDDDSNDASLSSEDDESPAARLKAVLDERVGATIVGGWTAGAVEALWNAISKKEACLMVKDSTTVVRVVHVVKVRVLSRGGRKVLVSTRKAPAGPDRSADASNEWHANATAVRTWLGATLPLIQHGASIKPAIPPSHAALIIVQQRILAPLKLRLKSSHLVHQSSVETDLAPEFPHQFPGVETRAVQGRKRERNSQLQRLRSRPFSTRAVYDFYDCHVNFKPSMTETRIEECLERAARAANPGEAFEAAAESDESDESDMFDSDFDDDDESMSTCGEGDARGIESYRMHSELAFAGGNSLSAATTLTLRDEWHFVERARADDVPVPPPSLPQLLSELRCRFGNETMSSRQLALVAALFPANGIREHRFLQLAREGHAKAAPVMPKVHARGATPMAPTAKSGDAAGGDGGDDTRTHHVVVYREEVIACLVNKVDDVEHFRTMCRATPCNLGDETWKRLVRRLGCLNVCDPLHVDDLYDLDLRYPDERRMDREPVPGWTLPASWDGATYDGQNHAGVPTIGHLSLWYATSKKDVDRDHVAETEKFRKDLRDRFFKLGLPRPVPPASNLAESAQREMLVPAHNRSSVRRGRPRRGKKKS
ncbi:hypothetical protein JL722_1506 [Aureococcus anophagefferens]|nr:hypothetical protein JL722_1506 [Aureococcus anophagefferens]